MRIDRGFVADHTRCALDNVSDLLRSLNHELGHPINTFITTSAVVDRVLRDQSLVDGSFDGPHHPPLPCNPPADIRHNFARPIVLELLPYDVGFVAILAALGRIELGHVGWLTLDR